MQAIRLWLEDDPHIPTLKRLAWDLTEVDICEIIERGVHPYGDKNTTRTLIERVLQLLNEDKCGVPGLADLGYCEPISSHGNHYYSNQDQLEELFKCINQNVRFVDDLTFQEMLQLAKDRLRQDWSHKLARRLAKRIHYNFNDLRRFIRSRNPRLKLRGYGDLDDYDLSTVLKLEDFEAEDKVIISEGLPVANFRTAAFADEVTDSGKLLRLTDKISDFELHPPNSSSGYGYSRLVYRGRWGSDAITLMPTLGRTDDMRFRAQAFARQWREDDGTYCFQVSVPKLSRMLDEGGVQISFPRLDYMRKRGAAASTARLRKSTLKQYSIGEFATARCSGDTLKGILRRHGVPMTGTKDRLLEKLVHLACLQYKRYSAELSEYFSSNRFVRAASCGGSESEKFPVLYDNELKNLLITMFALKHLRGNAILDPSYDNDTVDLPALAKSLINEDISLDGCFLQVER